jgi:hypothetical protein
MAMAWGFNFFKWRRLKLQREAEDMVAFKWTFPLFFSFLFFFFFFVFFFFSKLAARDVTKAFV